MSRFSPIQNPLSWQISDPVQSKSAWTGLDYESSGLIQSIPYSVRRRQKKLLQLIVTQLPDIRRFDVLLYLLLYWHPPFSCRSWRQDSPTWSRLAELKSVSYKYKRQYSTLPRIRGAFIFWWRPRTVMCRYKYDILPPDQRQYARFRFYGLTQIWLKTPTGRPIYGSWSKTPENTRGTYSEYDQSP